MQDTSIDEVIQEEEEIQDALHRYVFGPALTLLSLDCLCFSLPEEMFVGNEVEANFETV